MSEIVVVERGIRDGSSMGSRSRKYCIVRVVVKVIVGVGDEVVVVVGEVVGLIEAVPLLPITC